jgi:hypothetical protein
MSGLERLRQSLADRGYGDRLMRDEPLSRHTSFAIGGPADCSSPRASPPRWSSGRAWPGPRVYRCWRSAAARTFSWPTPACAAGGGK